MKMITLPEGTTHVPFRELAHLIAAALWPCAGEGDDRLDYGFARASLDTELKKAVQSGDLPVKDPLTHGVHLFPIGNALLSALVTVADINAFVAPRGLDVQVERLNKGGANWDLWADMEQARLWEAVALSLDIEPNSLPGLNFRPIVGGPFDDCPDEFKTRLKLAVSKFYDANTEIRLSSLREWGERLTRPWTFPAEFPHKHEHRPEPAAVSSAPDATKPPEQKASEQDAAGLTDWRMQIQTEAWEYWLRLRASGCNPSIFSICDYLAKWCIDKDIKGGKGQNPRAGTIRNAVLGAGHWAPPTHSVEQAKAYVAQIAQIARTNVARMKE